MKKSVPVCFDDLELAELNDSRVLVVLFLFQLVRLDQLKLLLSSKQFSTARLILSEFPRNFNMRKLTVNSPIRSMFPDLFQSKH